MEKSSAWQANIAFKRVVAPYDLTYAVANPSYTKWSTITNNTATVRGTAPITFGISPALPTGLSFNTTNGTISGTPTVKDIAGTNYTITATNVAGSTQVTMNLAVVLSPFTWIGGTSTDWQTGGNWYGSAPPTANTHDAIFDNECTVHCNSNIAAAITVGSILLKPNYTGTVTQASGVGNVITSGTNALSTSKGIIVEAGAFVGGDANIRTNYVTVTGGSFTSTSAELRLGASNGSVSATWGVVLGVAGTFTHNSGTVYLDATASSGNRQCLVLQADQTIIFYNLSVDCEDTSADDNYNSHLVVITGTVATVNVLNELNYIDGRTGEGTIQFYGSQVKFYCTSAQVCSGATYSTWIPADVSTRLIFKGHNGTGAQTYWFEDGAGAPSFRIENASGVSSATSTGTLNITALHINTGTFTAPASTLGIMTNTIIGQAAVTAGLVIDALGVFAHNNGTVIIGGYSNFEDSTTSFTLSNAAAPSMTFNNLILNQRNDHSSAGRSLRRVSVPAGFTIYVLGSFTKTSGSIEKTSAGANPLMILSGNYTIETADFSINDGGELDNSIDKRFIGTAATINIQSPSELDCASCIYTFDPGAGNTITLNTGIFNLALMSAATSVVLSSGTLHLNASTGFVVSGNFTNNGAVTCGANAFILYHGSLSGTPGGGHNAACVRTVPTDYTPDVVTFTNFNNQSSTFTFTGVTHSTRIQISVAHNVGTVSYSYRLDGGADGAWTVVSTGSPATVVVLSGHRLQFRVTGGSGNSGTFTLRTVDDNAVIGSLIGSMP